MHSSSEPDSALADDRPEALLARIAALKGQLASVERLLALHDGPGRHQLALPNAVERRQLETELRHSQTLLQSLIDHAPAIILAKDLDGRYLIVNRRLATMLGCEPSEVVGRTVQDLFPPAIAAAMSANDQEVLRTGLPLEVEESLPVDGELHTQLAVLFPIVDAAGATTAVGLVAPDITERTRIELALRQALENERAARVASERAAVRIARLQALTAALSEARTPAQVAEVVIAHVRADLGASSSTVRLADPAQHTLDLLMSEGLPPELLARWAQTPLETSTPITTVAQTGEPLFFESREALSTDYPSVVDVAASLGIEASAIVPLRVEGRTIGSLSLTFSEPRSFDLDDRSFVAALAGLSAQAIERARLYTAAQEAVEARDTFLAVASHDLRAPLTVLLGQVQLLERQAARLGQDVQIGHRAQQIAEQARRLSRMMDMLLDLARIQVGKLTIDVAPLDLAQLALRVVAEMQLTVADPVSVTSRHTIVVTGADEPLPVQGDGLRLEQVLCNLIDNAIKYSPSGGPVYVQLSREAGQAQVAVIDEGIGISPVALPHLFSRYYRAPRQAAHSIRGLGIGLYVVREIVTLHHGEVLVTSVEGVGSTFTVVLPLLEDVPRPAAPCGAMKDSHAPNC